MQNTIIIEEYSFHDFLAKFQEAVISGYRLNLESNDLFPQKYGSHLFCGLELEVDTESDIAGITVSTLTKEGVEKQELKLEPVLECPIPEAKPAAKKGRRSSAE